MNNLNKNISALLQLLDDPDEEIFNVVKNELLDYGKVIINELEEQWETADDDLKMQRIENLIYTIKSSDVQSQIKEWIAGGAENLLVGALLVAKFQYHNINEDKIYKLIQQIKQDIWIEINDYQTSFEKVKTFNQVFYNAYGFKGNKEDFHAPQNSFINRVISSKKGNPLSLGIVYLTIAQSLDLPIYGVNLPHHFVLVYKDEKKIVKEITGEDSENLFYINPFTFGSAFGKHELTEFIKHLKVEDKPSFYEACSNIDIIKRMILNIIYSYDKENKSEKATHYKEILNLFN